MHEFHTLNKTGRTRYRDIAPGLMLPVFEAEYFDEQHGYIWLETIIHASGFWEIKQGRKD